MLTYQRYSLYYIKKADMLNFKACAFFNDSYCNRLHLESSVH